MGQSPGPTSQCAGQGIAQGEGLAFGEKKRTPEMKTEGRIIYWGKLGNSGTLTGSFEANGDQNLGRIHCPKNLGFGLLHMHTS